MIEKPHLLSIGINSGGVSPANHLVHEALGSFQRLVIRSREAFRNAGLRVNIVFATPGPLFKPDFQGVHATRIRRDANEILVVAAVPEDLTYDDVSSFIADVLRQAIAEARTYLRKRKVSVSTSELEAFINHLPGDLATPVAEI